MLADSVRRIYKHRWFFLCLRLVLGSIFLVAGASKLFQGAELLSLVMGYGLLPQNLAYIYASSLPLLEICIGSLLIIGLFPRLVSAFSIALTASFIIANVYSLFTGASVGLMCGCFGEVIPLTHAQSLVLNFIMLSMATFMLFRHPQSRLSRAFTAAVKASNIIMVLLVGLLVFMSFPAPVVAADTISDEIAPADDSGVNTIDANLVAESGHIQEDVRPALLYFYDDKCHNCQQQKPVIDELENEYGDSIAFTRIDARHSLEMLREFEVTVVPTMVVLNGWQADGEQSYQKFEGYTEKDSLGKSLKNLVDSSLSIGPTGDYSASASVAGLSIEAPAGYGNEPISAIFDSCDYFGTPVANLVAPTGQTLLWPNGASVAIFGPNASIHIDTGTIMTIRGCGEGGVDDWIYPYADIYIVPSGSVSVGGALTDAGGSKNTVWGASGGLFISQTIGYTSPGGNIGPGTYAVVYDECQNGKLDDIDALFDPAFEVVITADVPPMPASIANVKAAAAEQAEYHLMLKGNLKKCFDGLHFAEDVLSVPECVLSPAKCLLNFALGKIKEQLSAALGIGIDAEGAALAYVGNMAQHYLGIAADPPDPNYRELTLPPPVEYIDAQSIDTVLISTANLTNALGTEGALAAALLTSIERYQGADGTSDGEWALIHARTARMYASMLAGHLSSTNGAVAALDAALLADTRPLDDAVSTLDTFQERVEASGMTDNETRSLLNLGLSPEEIDELSADCQPGFHRVYQKRAA